MISYHREYFEAWQLTSLTPVFYLPLVPPRGVGENIICQPEYVRIPNMKFHSHAYKRLKVKDNPEYQANLTLSHLESGTYSIIFLLECVCGQQL